MNSSRPMTPPAIAPDEVPFEVEGEFAPSCSSVPVPPLGSTLPRPETEVEDRGGSLAPARGFVVGATEMVVGVLPCLTMLFDEGEICEVTVLAVSELFEVGTLSSKRCMLLRVGEIPWVA